jgi:(p)ppGpp synthase/HD superfamily hydrolase
MNEVLEKIKDYADKAHGDQMRKYTPERYIVHPIRVMELCKPYNSSLPVLASALLHDVLEDTAVTEEQMKGFLLTVMSEEDANETVHLVVELTDVYVKKDYPQWNRKTRKEKETERIEQISADAQTIKYADIIDNCIEIVRYDQQFGPKFLRECKMLLHKMRKGNPELYRKAVDMVNQSLNDIPLRRTVFAKTRR